MDFQKVLGASLAVQLIDVLGDDRDPSALLAQPGLTLGNGKVPSVWQLALHDLAPVMVELPHLGRVPGKGLRGGQVLGERGGRRQGGKAAVMLLSRTRAAGAPNLGGGSEHGEHPKAFFSDSEAGGSGRLQAGTCLLKVQQCGRRRTGAWPPACVPILGTSRALRNWF